MKVYIIQKINGTIVAAFQDFTAAQAELKRLNAKYVCGFGYTMQEMEAK